MPPTLLAQPITAEALEQLLQMELFSKTTKSLKSSLEKFGQLLRVPEGTEFVQQREFSGEFYVVLSGIVSAYRTESDGSTRLLDQLGAGEWFGEVSALSNQPALAKLKADMACSVLKLDSALFKEMYKVSRKFKACIDDRYRERSLSIHLAVIPSLQHLKQRDIKRLESHARFETFDAGSLIAEAGQPVDALYLVRSGSVTVHQLDAEGQEQLAGYLRESSSFGEEALTAEPGKWRCNHRAMTRTELLILPADAVRRAFSDDPVVLTQLQATAKQVHFDDMGGATQEELEIMVNRQSAKGGEALVIDLEKCVRCNACVESCVAVHSDGVPRLSKKGNRVSAESNALGKPISLVTACDHCQNPGCMMACGFGAIRRDPQGLIRFIWDNCVGCADCVKGCPYDVIRLTSPPDEGEEQAPSLFEKLPLIGGLFKNDEPFRLGRGQDHGFQRDKKAEGKAVKCDRCEGLPFEACVYNCPCGAIERRSPNEIFPDIVQMSEDAS